MSTTDPTGEGGGGGGGGEGATTTNVEQAASPSTPTTGTTVPVQATAQQQPQHPPPSPLSGCYLLVVLPEPHTAQHKDLILNRLAKGFLSWDKDSCHVDLEKELLALVAQAPEGEEARNGERLIQYATENLVTEVLIHPQTNTLLQCIRNLLASFTKHRHIIHAGYTFGGNGSWILQDGTFSLADFLDAFSEHEVQRVLRAYENSVTVDIHCAGVGDWTTSRLSKEACCRSCRVRVNPDDVLTAGVPAITSFTNYIGQYLVSQTLDQLMEPSDVVGNIRFSHPTLYVFPGGQGDAALFGINGFNMLVDGGFARKACFWDFTRHLDRLDAVLVTRINNSNIGGMFSVLHKKKEMHVYPQIGHFFCNLVERRQSNSPDGDKDIDPLILNLTDIGQEMVVNLRHINLRAHPCYRDPDPINLYHKVGHGTLDMYVLSPSKDSREVREFLAKWHASDSKLFAGSHKKDSNNLTFPIQNLVSICALLVWQPANPEDNITRILFPGSTPQHKIFEGFQRLKHLDFLKHPVCSAKTLSPSASLATLRDKPAKQKLSLIDKEPKKISEPKKEKREPSEPKSIKAADEAVPKSIPQSTPIIPTSRLKAEMKTKKVVENKKIETEAKESKKIEKELKEVKKEPKKEPAKVEKPEKREDDVKKTDLIKPEPEKILPKESKESKEPKLKPEPKKKELKESKVKVELKKSEITPKLKPSEKKTRPSGMEKKDSVKSSPTTPKKTLNGTATKTEISKAVPKAKPAAKVAPSLPAKSAKEANNRKVVEQKKSEVEKSAVKDIAAPVKVSAKPKPMDRKPISRRPKPASPSKVRMPGSPAKSTRSTPTASVKSDKDGVIRKVKGDKGTTDSSTVSTPSGIEPEAVKPTDKSLIEQSEDISLDSIESKVLADLKEEREVVEEIEAVLQKAERIEETRKDDHFEGDDEITAEATDKKEEDITEEDVTAEIEDVPKKEGSRKESQELTEEDEYLIVEKEEVYTEDSAQSGEGEQKHVLDEAQSEKAKILKDVEAMKEKGEKEEPEEKGKDDSPEKKVEKIVAKDEKEIAAISSEHKEQLQEEVKEIIASAAEIVQKAEEKDDSGKKDSDDITKEPSSLSPDKLDSSEKKTTDTDMKPDVDQKENILEKMEESQERISTIESGATTTAPTLPEDERIPLDEIKEDIDEKHVIEEVKEKDAPAKLKKEVVPETVPAAAKPEVKVFDVRQAMQNLQRDIVKTPDEVADLPVHEEVDPKLYRMEDFEKGKEEKPSPTPQESKEPPTPPAKEQKGVFSFFGKVADKFEKGYDKLTKKTKKDSEKDSDEKSTSKSSSPKEPKAQEKTFLQEVDMAKVFPKMGKSVDKPEMFEEAKPTIADVKMAAIKETATFIQEEILDTQKQSVPGIEEKLPTDKFDEIKKAETKIEESFLAKDVSPAAISPAKPIDEDIAKEIELLKEEDIGEEAEEVQALLEEASKKFKTVKDSLRDSLESLEEKIKEEEIVQVHEIPSALKDAVKDTLTGVVEKLEEIKPHIESDLADIKEPEKVKFDIPKDEEFEKEYEEELEGPYRDLKEAVRDVGEVLAGTAGINLEEKPKDVIEIVKKVAEVLREDDFLFDKTLLDQAPKKDEISPISTDRKPSKEEISPISTERKPSVPSEKISPEKVAKLEEEESKLAHEDTVISKKVGVTEVFPVHEELEELIEKPGKLLAPYEKPGAVEVKEEPCVKMLKEKDDIVTSPVRDTGKDKRVAQKICAEMLKDDQHICDNICKKPTDDDTSRLDVMQAGIESECVKKVTKRPSFEQKLEDEIEQPVIGFEQKVSPAKAEIVMVTPGSTPTSPKFVADKIYDEGLEIGFRELPKLPDDIKQVLSREAPVEEVIEELIITKKKITIEVIEYITVVKRIPRERVIYIIEEIIIKKGLPRESVVDDPEILRLKESITPEKRLEIEEYIVDEYIVKGKRITIQVVEEISIKKVVPKKIVIEIIEEIIVKRKITRHMVLDVPEEVLSEIVKDESPEESPKQSAEEQITPKIDITAKRESIAEVSGAPTGEKELIMPQKQAEVEEFIVNEYVNKGKKITALTIDEISAKKIVPKQILIEIIEEIIIKKKIPRNVVLDVTEAELLAISKKTPEDEKEKLVTEALTVEIPELEEPITSQKRAEVEEYIINEYVTKGDKINIKKLEEICGKKKVPKKIIIEIIEEIIIKRKMPKHAILSVTEEELSRIIQEEAIPEPQVLAEKRKSIAEVPSPEEKKSPIKPKEDKKEDVLEQEISSEEELSAMSEEEDVEEEVDGFVSIPRRISDTADAKKKSITELSPLVAKEHEKDVIDDFEAVEQEYKVRDAPITSPEKAHEMKEKEDIEEAAEDTASEVIEADEKFVQETKGKMGIEEPQIAKDIKSADKKREPEEREASEISEIVDTTEKYLDEAKEKTDDVFLKETTTKLMPSISDKTEKPLTEESSKEALKDISDKRPSIDVPESISKSIIPSPETIDEKIGVKETEPAIKEKVEEQQLKTKDDTSKPTSPIKSETLKDTVHSIEQVPEKVVEGVKSETKLADATGFAQEPKVELLKDDQKSKLLDTTEIKETPVTKEDKSPQEKLLASISSKIDDGTVKRMLVTACSEDGREEIEICPTGSITFTKIGAPDDSLKDVSAKSIPDKDSLILDKDSHSGVSTPEKDSLSEISAPEDKDKITPEDSLEKSPVAPRDSKDLEDGKPKVPEKLEDITKPKSPVEKEDLKVSDKIAEKDKPKSPKEEQEEPKSLVKDAGEIQKIKSPAEEKIEEPGSLVEKIEKSRSPSPQDVKHEEVQKPRSPLDMTTEKSPIESAEKPKLPIEKVLPEPKKEGTIGVPKTPESLHSEDISPAETIFSKSPTEMYFAKSPISEEDVTAEGVIKKLPGSVKEIKPAIDKELPMSLEKTKELEDKIATDVKQLEPKDKEPVDKSKSTSIPSEKSEQDIKSLDKSPSVLSDKAEEKETDKPKSPSVIEKEMISEKLPIFESEHYDEKGPIDEARSPSAISDKSDERREAEHSKSPSIAADKPDLQDVTERLEKPKSPIFDRPDSPKAIDKTEEPQDKDRSPSVASDKSDSKKVSDRSRSPSISIEKVDFKDMDLPIERNRSPSVTSVKDDKLEQLPVSQSPDGKAEIPKDALKSPKLDEYKADLKDVMHPPLDKSRSPSVTSAISEPKEPEFHSKSPSDEKPGLKSVAEQPFDKSRSPSVISVTGEQIDVPLDKSRSSSVVSVTGIQKEPADLSKSPSIAGEKPDMKDVSETPMEKSRSPSVTTEQKEPVDQSKSSSIVGEEIDLKDVAEPADRSKPPSIIGEKPDLKDVTTEKSRSPSIAGEQKESLDHSKPPSIAGEKPDLKDVTDRPDEKSRSSSVMSTASELKEPDRSKSPSIAGDKPDLMDITEQLSMDKFISPSVTSDQKEPMEKAKPPTFLDKKEEPDRSKSPPSVVSEEAKSAVSSKPSSVAGDVADLKDILEPSTEKSRSPSVDQKESMEKAKPPTFLDKKEEPDRSKSPPSVVSEEAKSAVSSKPSSVAGDVADLKDILEPSTEKSRSPSVDQKESMEKAKPPTFLDKKEEPDRSKSPSVVSEEAKSAVSSKPSSVAGDVADLKDVLEPSTEKFRSPSADQKELTEKAKPSTFLDKKEEPGRSKSPSVVSEEAKSTVSSKPSSVAGDMADLKDVLEPSAEKSKSPSVVSADEKESMEKAKPPTFLDKKEEPDRSKSPSVVSEEAKSVVSSKASSVAGDMADLKDVLEPSAEKSKSPSVVSADEKEPMEKAKPSTFLDKKEEPDRSKSPSVVSEEAKSTVSSKASSVAGDMVDLKDVLEPSTEKSRSPSVVSADQKEPMEKVKPPTFLDKKEEPDRSKSPSVVSEETKSTVSSKQSSVAGDMVDLKDLLEPSTEKFKSPSVVSADEKEPMEKVKPPTFLDKKEEADRSKSPSVVSEEAKSTVSSKPSSVAGDIVDLKDILEPSAEKSKSPSVVSADEKEPMEKAKPPTFLDKKEEPDRSKSPSMVSKEAKSTVSSKPSSVAGDMADLKDVLELSAEKSKSPSVVSADQKEPMEKAKSPTFLGKKEEPDSSKSPSVVSEEAKSTVSSKPSSVAGDMADLKDVLEPSTEKSRSPSVISATSDQKEPIEKPVSPMIPHKVGEAHDKSKSPSMASEKSDEKKSADGSRATSVTEEKPDLKDVTEPPTDKSRSSSVASEKAELFEKSTFSDKLEPSVDRSKSPSVASDKSDEKAPDDKPPTVSGKMDIKPDDITLHEIGPLSSSIVFDKPMDDKQMEKIDIDGLKTSGIIGELDFVDKSRSLSIISDKTEPKSPSDVSKSPSLADDQKDKSSSSSAASEKLDDMNTKISLEAKRERSISPSMDTAKKDESAKSSRASSPVDKTPKDRSRSHSVFDVGEKTPVSRSRTASLFEDKLPEKQLPQKEKDAFIPHLDTGKPLDEKDECKKDAKSPITSPETIEKEMQKIREKRFADFKEPDVGQPSKIEKLDDEEEDVVIVTAEKKAEIEKYILDEFILRKRKISLTMIERLVMMYSVPQFIVMEIIEDIISRQNIPRNVVFDFIDDESSEPQYGGKPEAEILAPKERAEIEEYIIEEFIVKKKKITPEALDEMVILKSVPRYILITIIEEIIVKRKIPRSTVIEGDLGEPGEKREKPLMPTSMDFGRTDITPEYIQGHVKPDDAIRGESPDGKISPVGSDRYRRDSKAALSASPSLSPEPIPSDKSTQDSPARSEPHIDEEFLISEERRMEIEKLLEEEYIKKGRKITEVILEEIILRTSLPRYIILEILEEIILKRKIPRESVIDMEIYQEEEEPYRYEGTADVDYELPHDARKSSIEYRMGMYPESGERQLDKPDYPTDYESQFHKAFVGGMTEMRTTHITTLSGKSTPEFATHDATVSGIAPIGKAAGPQEKINWDQRLPDHDSTLTTTHITRTDVEDTKAVPSAQTVTILRESKIAETIDKDEPEDSAGIPATVTKIVKREIGESKEPKMTSDDTGKPDDHATESDGDIIVVKKIIKREVIEGEEPEKTTKIMKEIEEIESQEIAKEVKRPSVQPDEPEAITKIIKREIVERDEPEVITKVVKREIIEQDEPEIITKVIRREVVVPGEETSDSKEDSDEYVKTITTRTTRTIITEELSDTELAQTDPSKTYTDPTSGTTYRVVSDESAPDATISADVKQIMKREIVEHDEPEVISKVVKREIIDQDEPEIITKVVRREVIVPGEETSDSKEDSDEYVKTITTRTTRTFVTEELPDAELAQTDPSKIYTDPTSGTTYRVVSDEGAPDATISADVKRIIKREIVEHDEPEVITKVVKREIIDQDEPEIITKVIRREVVVPDEETSDSKEDSDEYVKTITTRTTRTIVTEELPDAELAQTDPSKIYTDPTSGTTYRVVSDESAPDATVSADVKRIVTTVTTITGPDGKVVTTKDVKESTDTVASEELLEKLMDSSKSTIETTEPAEKIVKETIATVTSGTSTPDVKALYDSGKSTPDLKQEDKLESTVKERLDADKFEHPVSPLVRELIYDDKSYSGKSSPDISLPKDIVFSGSTGKSTPEIPMSPLVRDGAVIQPHVSGRSTPDRRSDGRSLTSTPEGFRSGEMIRTIVTTTKTISDEGEIVTTTKEVTETTNEKGETVVLAEKTDVKVDERLPSKNAAESAISSIIGSIKSSELQRSDSPGSDDATSEKDRGLASPPSEHSSVRSKAHPWGSSEERHTYSDDEPPSSPLSSTSQVGYSSQAMHRYEPTSDKEEEQKQVEFSAAAMSSSFYGELPAVPPQISAMKTFHGETGIQKGSDPIQSRFTVEKEPAGVYGEKPDAKRYVDEADLDFDKALMEHKEVKETSGAFSSGIAPRYTNGSVRHEAADEKDHPSSSFQDDAKDDSKGDSKKDPLEGWGTPLGLPSPKPPRKFNLKNSAQTPSCSSETSTDTLSFNVLKDWGEPLRLPSPAPVTNEVSNKGAPGTPKKERKQTKKVQSENIKNKKRSESPGKNEKKVKDSKNKVQPVYMDLAYVPHHGNSYYTSFEFFKRVRARYYVFSGTEPSREVYDALLEAKKTWEDKDLEVTMIPTYDTDTLGYWVADNEEALAANHIDLSPSASRCTINLQDHETSCSAYRLEF